MLGGKAKADSPEGNDRKKGQGKNRFPLEMTTRKARTNATATKAKAEPSEN